MSERTPFSLTPGLAFPALPKPVHAALLAVEFQLGRSQWWKPEALRAAQLLQRR